jgi:enamine deaminase RidA (YjgF/YER057c/UK114 family)
VAIDVRPADWPLGSGYAHGFAAEGRLLFVAGQIGWDPITQAVAPGLVEQTRQALANVVAVLRAGGAEPSNLVRLTWFITDRDAYLRDRKAIGAAYRDVIGRHFPPMSVIVVAGLLEPGALVEIEATAVIPAATPQDNSSGA